MTIRHNIPMFSPYVSPKAIERVKEVLTTPMIGQGEIVTEFEKAIEKTLNLNYVVAVYNSAAALRLALSIIGVGPGDEVITTPLTCTLTNHPILEQFAKPSFADIQTDTGNINPVDVRRRITEKTKAIICTHWGGTPCDIDELNEIGFQYNIPVIEDASEAFGAVYRSRFIGSHSRFVAFSFHAIQIVTASEGGALVTQSQQDADLARKQRWYGIDRASRKSNLLGYYDFDVTTVGYGYYMTNVAAAIGLENLKMLKVQKAHREMLSRLYREKLSNIPGLQLLKQQEDRESSHHFFTVLVENRENFCKKLHGAGVQVSIVHARNDGLSLKIAT